MTARSRAGPGVVAVREQPLHHPGESGDAAHPSEHGCLPTNLGSISADPRKVKQIVYNLLSNAVKFTDRGRSSHPACSPRPALRRRPVERPLEWAELPVGRQRVCRIPQTQRHRQRHRDLAGGLEHLFKPFSQIDSGLARKFEGTGLGLAMVKLLAELHGGAVAVESAVGQGSCFTVWLPWRTMDEAALALASATGQRIAALPRTAHGAGGGRRLQIRRTDSRAARGGRLASACTPASAEAALALAVQQPLALITLDIMLPDMDGWEFLTRLKQMPALRHIPVVIISIVADRNEGLRARCVGGHAKADVPAGVVRRARRPRPVSAFRRVRCSKCSWLMTIPRPSS